MAGCSSTSDSTDGDAAGTNEDTEPPEAGTETETPNPESETGPAVLTPDIQSETEFTAGDGPDDFGVDPDAGCGILTIYTFGGSESVGTDRIKIAGSSHHPDNPLWWYSAYYNTSEEIAPEPRADSPAVRVSSTDDIRLLWITDDGETVTLADVASISQYC
jgi:hypothetical protein